MKRGVRGVRLREGEDVVERRTLDSIKREWGGAPRDYVKDGQFD